MYPEATIDAESYRRFSSRLHGFLSTDAIDFEVLANFLRNTLKLQRCFQIGHTCCGKPRYIEAEKVFAFEHNSKARVSDATRNQLLHEIDEDEFYAEPMPGRLMLNELEEFFKSTEVSLDNKDTLDLLKKHLHHSCYNVDQVVPELDKFCRTVPRLPDESAKMFRRSAPIELTEVSSAEQALDAISALRGTNESCDLAFSAFRDLSRSPWKPFLKAAFERNPVSVNALKELSVDALYARLNALAEQSIYNEPFRIAQPDEVWNYGRGDGLEKAITLAATIKSQDPGEMVLIDKSGDTIRVAGKEGKSYKFTSSKSVRLPEPDDINF